MTHQNKEHSSSLPQCEVFVFGISGASCSGKTTVSKHLCDTLPHTIIIHQDDFYITDLPQIRSDIYTGPLWDVPEAIDTARFLEVMRTTIKNPQNSCKDCKNAANEDHAEKQALHTILVEGIMILEVKELYKLLSAVFFITIDYDTCKKRRSNRTYPAYPPGSAILYVDPPGYVEKAVWPGYLRNKEVALSLASAKVDNPFSVFILDGEKKTLSELQNDVESEIRKTISTKLEPLV